MTYPDSAIRKAVYAALTTTKIILSGKEVKVFDTMASTGAAAPYIILDGQQNLPDHTKDDYGWKHVFTLRIISTGKGDVSGREANERVLALVTPRLTPDRPGSAVPFLVTGWNVWKVAMESRDLPQLAAGDGTNIYQKVLTLTLNVY